MQHLDYTTPAKIELMVSDFLHQGNSHAFSVSITKYTLTITKVLNDLNDVLKTECFGRQAPSDDYALQKEIDRDRNDDENDSLLGDITVSFEDHPSPERGNRSEWIVVAEFNKEGEISGHVENQDTVKDEVFRSTPTVNPDQLSLNKIPDVRPSQTYMSKHYVTEEQPVKSMLEGKVLSKNEIFECDACGKTFSYERSLNRHKKVHDNNDTMKGNQVEPVKDFECASCCVTFTTSKEFFNHKCTIARCSICDKMFPSMPELRLHTKKHIGEMPYQCSVCNKRFKRKCLLVKHTEIHFKFGMADSSNFREYENHQAIQKPSSTENSLLHKCIVCGVEFSQKKQLMEHFQLFIQHGRCPSQQELTNTAPEQKTEEKNAELEQKGDAEAKKDPPWTGKPSEPKTSGRKPFGSGGSEDKSVSVEKKSVKGGKLGRPRTRPEKPASARKEIGRIGRPGLGFYPFKCKLCDKAYSKRTRVRKHIQTHPKTSPYRCDDCGEGFNNDDLLQKHGEIHKSEKPYACDVCPQKLASRDGLKLHMLIHSGVKAHHCPICSKGFYHPCRLKNHDCTAPREDRHNAGPVIKCFCCDLCNKRFTKAGIGKHVPNHLREERYKCNICGKKFHFQPLYKSHMALHSMEKTFLCEACGKGFNRKKEVVRHSATCGKLKKHVCEVCGIRVSNKRNLDRHMLHHSEKKPFSCYICGKGYVQRITLQTHMATHSSKNTNNNTVQSNRNRRGAKKLLSIKNEAGVTNQLEVDATHQHVERSCHKTSDFYEKRNLLNAKNHPEVNCNAYDKNQHELHNQPLDPFCYQPIHRNQLEALNQSLDLGGNRAVTQGQRFAGNQPHMFNQPLDLDSAQAVTRGGQLLGMNQPIDGNQSFNLNQPVDGYQPAVLNLYTNPNPFDRNQPYGGYQSYVGAQPLDLGRFQPF